MLNRSQIRGFSLVELLVVIAIIALLLSVLLPSLKQAREEGIKAVCASNQRQGGTGFSMYFLDFKGKYPYGVPESPTTMLHPHYKLWGGRSGSGISPQQQFYELNYIRDIKIWVCPRDKTPKNYQWWHYRSTGNGKPRALTEGCSYMFSEDVLFGAAWRTHKALRESQVIEPWGLGLMSEGTWCPNGWTWGNSDFFRQPHRRIDWTHRKMVNVLFGDLHVEIYDQIGMGRRLRDNPLTYKP